MEIVIGLVILAGAVVAVVATTHRARGLRTEGAAVVENGRPSVGVVPQGTSFPAPRGAVALEEEEAEAPAGPSTADLREQLDLELVQRRAEVGRIEERLLGKEQSIDVKLADLERRERGIDDRQRNLEQSQGELKSARRDQLRELERIAGLTSGQAKQLLLRELEDELEHESARMIRQAEDEAKREADRRARSILATSMQRLAAGHAVETTVSVVQLRSDDMKGRIIGREGRNIRSLETLTGIDFIVDDTPSTVVLSGFDGVRREIARITLEKLLEDGRIHPARIEDVYDQAVSEMDGHVVEVGEQAVFDAEAGVLHPELVKLLGRLRYRTSYGQNVLAHSVECANLAGTLAAELGASAKCARRAALLHDIGKAVTHEIEGPHALVGGDIARRYGESEAVAHAMEAHHNEVELQTIEAVVVQIADSLSGARPGARGESLEHYMKRLRDLEQIANRHEGVEKVFAMQAGREVRVVVSPEAMDDDAAALLSHAIARDVEKELEFPGQIKVTVIRESRAVDYAK
ncbi:MAG: ribonuclease Y [Thermoleophilaceae bacterium]|nr:ribonuclease Y [Thermoleophilaceae bacterium]